MISSLFCIQRPIKYLFRADSRSPEVIRNSGGFRCRDPYANMDAKSHVIYGGPSNFIATSATIKGALASLHINGIICVYKINPQHLELEVVLYEKGNIMCAYQKEKEILVSQSIPWENVEGWYILSCNNLNYQLQGFISSSEGSPANQEERKGKGSSRF